MLNRLFVGTCLVLSLIGTITTKSAEATTVTWEVNLIELDHKFLSPIDIHSGFFRYDESVVTAVPGYGEVVFKLTDFSFEVNDIIYDRPQADLIFF